MFVCSTFEKIFEAKKSGNERRFRPIVDDLRRADLLDASLIHHGHPVANGICLSLIVSDIQGCHADPFQDDAQIGHQALAQGAIERSQRFVQQEQARSGSERTCQRDTLLFAARQLVDSTVPMTLQVNQGQHLPDPLRDLARGQLLHA